MILERINELQDTISSNRNTASRMAHLPRVSEEAQRKAESACEELEEIYAEWGVPGSKQWRIKTGIPTVPRIIEAAESKTPIRTKAYDITENVISGDPPALLVLGGGVGVGKTVALVSACLATAGVFVEAPVLASTLQGSFGETHTLWRMWREWRFLAIDECGTERKTPEAVADLLMLRWNAGLITVCAGNITAETFASRYFGEHAARMADRFRDQKHPWYVDCDGESLRGT